MVATLSASEAAAVRDLAAAVAAHDGVAAFSEQTLLNVGHEPSDPEASDPEASDPEGSDPERDGQSDVSRAVGHHLLLRDGELVGYAQRDGESAELAVHPEHRRHGLGGDLLDEVLTAAPASAVWAHGPTPGAAPLATARDLSVVRELWLMQASLADLSPAESEPTAPEGIEVTTFEADRDAPDWVRVNARAFAHHPEQGRMSVADLHSRIAQPWFDPNGFWLARDRGGNLLGSMWTKVADGIGEIYVLGIDPDAQGRGLGGFLTATAMRWFAAQDLETVELYVEADNHPAIRTYQRAGFGQRRADVQYARG